MIIKPTAFVVGAGSSEAYGFPLGGRLLQVARELQLASATCQTIIGGSDVKRAKVDAIISGLRQYAGPSIDAFLENQPQHVEIGHELIVALLADPAQQVRPRLLHPHPVAPEKDWLGFVIERMRRGTGSDWRQFVNGNRHVTFITFNFDNVIEGRLVQAIARIYGADVAESEVLETINVIHVHGALPAITSLSLDWITVAAQQIRVIHDELDAGIVRQAQEALRRSGVVCFIGFGYHSENLESLGIPGTLSHGPAVWGSSFDMCESDRADVRRGFPEVCKITLGQPRQDCMAFLQNHPVVTTTATESSAVP